MRWLESATSATTNGASGPGRWLKAGRDNLSFIEMIPKQINEFS
jgi:hypothetical protein